MGSDFDVAIVADSPEAAAAGYARALALGEALEARFSRFRPDSELSRLNREREIEASDEMLDALELARTLHAATGGAFNPLLSVARLGYDRDFATLPADAPLTPAAAFDAEFGKVRIDRATRRISLAPGQTLDFGGFVKGHAAERICAALADFPGAIVGIGGDIFTRGLDAAGVPFEFAVWNPIEEADGPRVRVRDGAVCTSGTYKRRWAANGRAMHHILDSDGTSSASDVVSATVVAKTGALAEAYATLAVVRGDEAAATLRAEGLPFALIHRDGRITSTDEFTD